MNNDEAFNTRMAEIEARIAALPEAEQARLRDLVEETRRRHENIRASTAAALNALDDWRIAMKYLIFDLEARARENGARG